MNFIIVLRCGQIHHRKLRIWEKADVTWVRNQQTESTSGFESQSTQDHISGGLVLSRGSQPSSPGHWLLLLLPRAISQVYFLLTSCSSSEIENALLLKTNVKSLNETLIKEKYSTQKLNRSLSIQVLRTSLTLSL